MEINFMGFACAAATFLGVWIGHVSVRRIERQVERLWIPSTIVFSMGMGAELVSLYTDNLILSAVFGILGITLLWDSLEFYRQQKRIRKGHAPANPRNQRHALILEKYASATTIDWLDRDPRGTPFTNDEIRAIKGDAR